MDRNALRAASFIKRAEAAESLTQKLLCIYDGFVCLYGPMEACRKAASASGLDRALLDSAIDFCMDDGDSPSCGGDSESRKAEISQEMVEKLSAALSSLVEKTE